MFNRPRCRDWTALATQQLRLRNLIQISGHNIICEPKSSIYFTLHLTSMSAPFFTSQKLEARQHAIWPEINCQSIVKSTAHSICIRVWQHLNEDNVIRSTGNNKPNTQSADKVLFLWGVYFSGLISISKRTDVKLKENSLVFHIHGGFFTSSECLMPESVPQQLDIIGIVSTPPKSLISAKHSCDLKVLDDVNLDLDCKIDVSASPPRNGRSASPDVDHISSDIKEKSNNHPEADPNLLKSRFLEKKFFKSEIRPSYTVDKLLLLQEKQRNIRYKSESAKEVMEKICMKSAFCLNLELIANKAMLYRPRGNPSMGRTLNRLLFQQPEQPKPEVLLKAQEIRRKIETAKFRCRLLVQEKNQAKINIRQLERKLGKISDINIEQESWLMANYRGLGKDKEAVAQSIITFDRQKDCSANIFMSLQHRRQQLLRELKGIYCVKQNDNGVFTINGAALPNAESYTDLISPSDISVALGYAAHITIMCSIILNCPLRNSIIYKGSASRIKDNIKMIPEPDREFPLFCRSCPPPDALLYAVFLLNQNIAQLKFMLGLNKEDLRATLPNLLQLMNGAPKEIYNKIILDIPKASISGSSVDLNVQVPVSNVIPLNYNLIKGDTRVCRSVGSYSDEPISKNRGHFNSEPILSAGPVQVSNFTDNCNI